MVNDFDEVAGIENPRTRPRTRAVLAGVPDRPERPKALSECSLIPSTLRESRGLGLGAQNMPVPPQPNRLRGEHRYIVRRFHEPRTERRDASPISSV